MAMAIQLLSLKTLPNVPMKFKALRLNSPERMTDEAVLTLDRGYLLKGETPNDMFWRLSTTFASYYPDGYLNYSSEWLRDCLYDAFQNCWISPASPVAANFGTKRGLPISCFLLKPENSIDGIFKTAWEAAMLTKNGGGIGIDVSDLIGESNLTSWTKLYDNVMNAVSQSGVRRGSVAIYVDIEHPNFWSMMQQKELSKGDKSTKVLCNFAVNIPDSFMKKLGDGDLESINRFSKVLELGLKYGSPYIHFVGNTQRQDPPWYKDKNLITTQSNLCSEITLHTDYLHTAVCVLSQLNLRYYDEWSNLKGLSLPELGILFLDAVCEDFITKAKNKKRPEALQNAIRFAEKSRALGLGVVGFHAWLMKNSISLEQEEAFDENEKIFHYIKTKAEDATFNLSGLKGEPEWCKGWKRRNSHLLAIAPTTTSSILCGGVTPGIEPIDAHYFAKSGAKGTFIRKNPILENLLEEKGYNTEEVWDSIRKNRGSVQHLNFLSEHEKNVFKTFPEVEPEALIRLTAQRQKYIDQAQSFNLYIDPDQDAQSIVNWHLLMWRLGVKTRYYIRSKSMMSDKNEEINVHIKTRPDCIYCKKAKSLLKDLKITDFTEELKPTGRVPEVWINGELLDDGYNSMLKYFYNVETTEEDCSGCTG